MVLTRAEERWIQIMVLMQLRAPPKKADLEVATKEKEAKKKEFIVLVGAKRAKVVENPSPVQKDRQRTAIFFSVPSVMVLHRWGSKLFILRKVSGERSFGLEETIFLAGTMDSLFLSGQHIRQKLELCFLVLPNS